MENSRDVAKQTLALVLAGGRGSRLHMLTDRRAKPAVFFGGKFRIIDFALSNSGNSVQVPLFTASHSGWLVFPAQPVQ